MLTPDSRRLFAFDPQTVYLNHGGFGAVPLAVTEARQQKLKTVEANPTRFFNDEFHDAWKSAVARVASRFSVRPQDLALVDNITDGANAVLRSIPLKEGDEILVTSMAYGSLHKAACYLAERSGAKVSRIMLRFPDPDPQQCIEAVKAAITPRTKLALLDHIAAPTALVLPLADMTKICHAHDVAVLADGAHVPGNIAFDIAATGVDWYTANLHKWYFVPRGCGFLWAAPKRQAGLVPTVLSWHIDKPFPDSFEWTGTRDPGAWLAIPDAFAFMDRFGEEDVRRHNHTLLRRGLDLLADAWKTPRGAPNQMIGSMGLAETPADLPYSADEEGCKKLERELRDNYNVTVCIPAIGHGKIWIRVSAQIYNSLEDYEKLATAVLTLRRK